jgi:hypothetical protein
MKFSILGLAGALVLMCSSLHLTGGPQAPSGAPQYTAAHELVRPRNYREWVYLSSGFGMEYSASGGAPKMFTNVFVTPFAYRRFMASGKWPDKTMFVLEERVAASKGSINKSGHYQTELAGLAVSIKDGTRFPDRWAYFSFGAGERTSPAKPKSACWACHNSHAAVDNTFVQFYPTLKRTAQAFGVYDEAKAEGPSRR